MYIRIERPPTDDERQQLRRMLADNRAACWVSVVCLVILLGILALKSVELYLGQWAGTLLDNPVTCWLVVALLVFCLRLPVRGLVKRRRERRHLRATLAGGLLVVERVEANAVARVTGRRGYWLFLAVAPDCLLVVPQSRAVFLWDYRNGLRGGAPLGGPGAGVFVIQPRPVHACFEAITTRSGSLVVSCRHLGTSTLTLRRPLLRTADLASERKERLRLEKRLNGGPLLSGRLETLIRDLLPLLATPAWRAGDGSPLVVLTGGLPSPARHADPWPLAVLQGRLENAFRVPLGPGRLAEALRRVEQEQGRPAVAADLLPLFLGRAPDGPPVVVAPGSLANMFYRLRSVLSEQFQLPPGRIRPATRLEEIVPRIDRSAHWDCVARKWTHLSLSGCLRPQYPAFVGWLMLVGIIAASVLHILTSQAIGAFARRHGFGDSWWFISLTFFLLPTSFLAALLLGGGSVLYLFRNFATLEFGPGFTTVGEVARYLAQLERGQPAEQAAWNAETLWLALRQALAEAADVRPLEISRDSELGPILAVVRPAS